MSAEFTGVGCGVVLCALPSLPRVVGIIIVDLPTGFNHEQKNSNANPGYHYEHDKKYFHERRSPSAFKERIIYATIGRTNDGENGFPHRQAAGVGAEGLSGMLATLIIVVLVLGAIVAVLWWVYR